MKPVKCLNLDLYRPGEVDGGEAAESQHVLQLLNGGRDQRDRLLLLVVLLQLPQTTDELGVRGINKTWRTERTDRDTSVVLLLATVLRKLYQVSAVAFTCWANQGGAAQVIWVMGSVHTRDVPTHRCPDHMEGSFVQTDTLHKLNRETQTEKCVIKLIVSRDNNSYTQ